jgi:hypothetical protein
VPLKERESLDEDTHFSSKIAGPTNTVDLN